MLKKLKLTKEAVEIVHRRSSPARQDGWRVWKRGLTQAQLGKLIGTTASVICRLEDADYEGHSLSMLRKIGGALNQPIESAL